jgi:RNA polymerase primary sigma factor
MIVRQHRKRRVCRRGGDVRHRRSERGSPQNRITWSGVWDTMVKRANHPWRRFYTGRSASGAKLAEPSNGKRRLEGKGIAIESGLQDYLRCINEAPLLDADEERELGRMVRAEAGASDRLRKGQISYETFEEIRHHAQEARTQMVRSNLRLVVNIAKQFANRGLPLSDLIEEGNLGLLRAVEGYDPSHETRFSTYASWWIKQAIKRALINGVQSIHIPAYMVEQISRWKQATAQLEDKLGRPPVFEEMCQYLDIKPRKARIIRKAIRAVSNPTRATEQEEGLTLSEMIADDKTPPPDELVINEFNAETVRRLLDKLDERESTILRLRFGLDGSAPVSLTDLVRQAGIDARQLCDRAKSAVRDSGDTLLQQAIDRAFDPDRPGPVSMEELAAELGCEAAYLGQRLASLYDSLEGHERAWVGLRFGLVPHEGMTLKEIGRKIGLTRERVRQIEHEALEKMNRMLNGDADEDAGATAGQLK